MQQNNLRDVLRDKKQKIRDDDDVRSQKNGQIVHFARDGSEITNLRDRSQFQTPKSGSSNHRNVTPTCDQIGGGITTKNVRNETENIFDTPMSVMKQHLKNMEDTLVDSVNVYKGINTPGARKEVRSKLPICKDSLNFLYRRKCIHRSFGTQIKKEDERAFIKELEARCQKARNLLEEANHALENAKEKNKMLKKRNADLHYQIEILNQSDALSHSDGLECY